MLLITTLESTKSTNSYLHELIDSKKENFEESIKTVIPEFYSVSTNNQTNGRGQKENIWISEPEKNILLSTIIYPTIKAEDQFLINMAITLGILDFCKKIIDSKSLSIKWPNDIYYQNKKLGGVLIEHTIVGDSILYSIIGVGLNINQIEFNKSLPNPISVSQITKQNYNIDKCVRDLLSEIIVRYNDGLSNIKSLKNDYLQELYRFEEPHSYVISNKPVSAKITGVNQYGMLCLTDNEGKKIECGFKEVSFVI